VKVQCVTVLEEVCAQGRGGDTNKQRQKFSVTFCAWFKELREIKT